jgi:hypothetical protein
MGATTASFIKLQFAFYTLFTKINPGGGKELHPCGLKIIPNRSVRWGQLQNATMA